LRVSFLVPVFSEVDSLRRTVALIEETCAAWDREILLLVHARSIPACLALCETLAAGSPRVRVHEQVRYPGQGHAFREGFALATGTHFLMMNADLETDPRDAPRLIRAIEGGAHDLVVGSRFMRGGAVDLRGYGPVKAAVTYAFQGLVGGLFGTEIADLTFCYKIGTAELFRSIAWRGTGHELAMETTLRPIAEGFRVAEVPTVWIARGEGRSSHAYLQNLRHLRAAVGIYGERLARRLR
jgi:glycosyltransferase involved in cell wall biosynthesis